MIDQLDHAQKAIKQIKITCEQAAAPLLHVAQKGAQLTHFFDFDISSLRDYSSEDIRYSKEYQEVFSKLLAIWGPVVYVFEIDSDVDPAQVLAAAKSYSGERALPAFRKGTNEVSRVLYVGKVKRNFWGRVIQHLGFYKVPATQGLQLFHWGRELNLKLKLTVFEFEPDMVELLPLLENAVAQVLEPLVGKHK
ncbi:hypothetical protein [Hymenobacter sp. GOD-10R]|uniref:hypothetical protein n=1 Tax=Hymenobacter sp. GOD-10R TaxID=3093922 RepID=UPI002D7A366B|nr:hypothetical protein [Hymenobacter sp. GOD-10R]WRQ30026.1 hypothetical protein SD425_07100 [Hymenobacter sp. GOD-10R]